MSHEKLQVTIMNLWNKLDFKELFVKLSLVKCTLSIKTQDGSLFYLSFLIIMHVGGTYFANHKTKNYFPEGVGLLNLSMGTFKE